MFLCRVAVAFGIPPSEVEKRFTEDDYSYLKAYWELEPFGEASAWLRHGQLMARSVNMCAEDNHAKTTDFTPPFHKD